MGRDAPTPEPVLQPPGVHNVLKLYLHTFIIPKLPGESDKKYEVVGIWDYLREIVGDRYWFTDYHVTQAGGDLLAERRILRANDNEGKVELLWLMVTDEIEFNEAVVGAAKQKVFTVTPNEGPAVGYHALNAGKEGFLAQVTQTTARGTKRSPVRYWDFHRLGELAAGEVEEAIFFFVEKDETTGWIRMLKGSAILPGDIEVY